MTEITDDYVRERFGANLPQENVDNLRDAMTKYGSNRWWESQDPLEVAIYQMRERILMVDISMVYKGLSELLDRPVLTHEFGLNRKGLLKEMDMALSRLKSERTKISDGERQQKVMESIRMLEDYAKKSRKPILYADQA